MLHNKQKQSRMQTFSSTPIIIRQEWLIKNLSNLSPLTLQDYLELVPDLEVVQLHLSDQVKLSTNWDVLWRNLAVQNMDIVEQGKVNV